MWIIIKTSTSSHYCLDHCHVEDMIKVFDFIWGLYVINNKSKLTIDRYSVHIIIINSLVLNDSSWIPIIMRRIPLYVNMVFILKLLPDPTPIYSHTCPLAYIAILILKYYPAPYIPWCFSCEF